MSRRTHRRRWKRHGQCVGKPGSAAALIEPLEPRVLLSIVQVGGAIADGTVWASGDTIHVTSSLTLASGATLTIEPGAVVKFNASTSFAISGTVNALGTAQNPITFTSIHDDSVGGDTNNNGAATTPAAGNWQGIQINNALSNLNLEHVTLRYGGGSGSTGISMANGIFDLQDVTLENFAASGIVISGSAAHSYSLNHVTLTNIGSNTGHVGLQVTNASATVVSSGLTTQNVAGAHVAVSQIQNFTSSDSSFSGSGQKVIRVDGGAISGTQTWSDSAVYQLQSNIGVTGTLDIAAGTVVKATSAGVLSVSGGGTLNVNGTAQNPVTFTSDKDDTAGGDSNGDGSATSPAAGQWRGISAAFNAGQVNLDHVEIRYTGASGSNAIDIAGGSASVTNSTIAHASNNGVRLSNAATATIANTTFNTIGANANHFAIRLDNTSSGGAATLTNNTITGSFGGAYFYNPAVPLTASGNTAGNSGLGNAIVVGSNTLDDNTTWQESLVYYLDNGLIINTGVTLTLAPGTIVKVDSGPTLNENNAITVNGTLNGAGTAETPIIFTSSLDDSVGGDTNADGGGTSPVAGVWKQLIVGNGGSSNLSHAEVRYAGRGNEPAYEAAFNTSAIFTDSLVRDALAAGVQVANTSIVAADFSGTTVQNVGSYGFDIQHTNPAVVADLTGAMVQGAGDVGLRVRHNANFTNEGISFSNTARDGAILINIGNGTPLSGTHHWAGGYTYAFNDGNDLQISSTGTLNLGAGAVLKFGKFDGIQVDGFLNVLGTAEDPVIFTSIKDDAHGGDSNGDGNATSPTAGDWFSLWVRDDQFDSPNIAAVMADHLQILYAGHENTNTATPALLVDGGTHEFNHLLIQDAFDVGVRSRNSSASMTTLNDLTIRNTESDALSLGPTGFGGGNGGGTVHIDGLVAENIGGDFLVIAPQQLSYSLTNFTQNNIQGFAGTRVIQAGSNEVHKDLVLGYTPEVLLEAGLQIESGSVTILPGTVVKVRAQDDVFSKRTIFARNGPLIANGTAQAPIIFTSSRDDSVGSDIDGDGNASMPTPGDWAGISVENLDTQLSHAEIRYAGGVGDFYSAALGLAGGSYSNLVIRDTNGTAVLGHSFTLQNSLLYNFTTEGVRTSSPFPPTFFTLINNTIHGGTIGVEGGNLTATLTNNSITAFSDAGVRSFKQYLQSDYPMTARHNNVHSPGALRGNWVGENNDPFTPLDNTGNLSADPLYANAAAGNFELSAGSPLLDAGDGAAAPALDRLGRPRVDDTSIVNTGSGSPAYTDIGAMERQGASDPGLNADLVVVPGSVTVDPADPFAPGQTLNIAWQVRNDGAAGTTVPHWRDTVYLSKDQTWDINDLVLGTFTRSGALGVDASYEGSLVAKTPAVIDGDYYILVRTDQLAQQLEADETNNSGASPSQAIALPELALPGAMVESLSSSDGTRTYKLELAAPLPSDLLLSAAFGNPGAAGAASSIELLIRRNALPSSAVHDGRSFALGGDDASLQVTLDEPGTWYVTVRTTQPPAGADNLTLTTELLDASIQQVTPAQAANSGLATLIVQGAGLQNALSAKLVSGGVERTAQGLASGQSSSLAATFDLQGLAPGAYDLVVQTPDGQLLASDAFQVLAGGPIAVVDPIITITAPEAIRFQQATPAILEIQVTNPTDNDLPVLLQFNGQMEDGTIAGQFRLLGHSEVGSGFMLAPAVEGGVPGLLPPRATASIRVEILGVGPDVQQTPGRTLTYHVGSLYGLDQPLDWAGIDPDSILDTESQSSIGQTWDDARDAIIAEARRLLGAGQTVLDATRILQSIAEGISGIGRNTFSGIALDDLGQPLASTRIDLHPLRDFGLVYSAITDAQGHFTIEHMVSDRYSIGIDGEALDIDPILISGDREIDGGTFALSPRIELPDVPRRVEVAPQLLDVNGTPHLLYVRDGVMYHSVFAGGQWQAASRVAEANAGRMVYGDTLVNGEPGLAVYFEQLAEAVTAIAPEGDDSDLSTSPNDVKIMVALATPDGQGGWTWHEPQVWAEHGQAALMGPSVIVGNDGNPLVVHQATDLTNLDSDADLYFNHRALTAAGPDQVVIVGVTLAEDIDLGDGQVLAAGSLVTFDADTGELVQLTPQAANFSVQFQIARQFKFSKKPFAGSPLDFGETSLSLDIGATGTANARGATAGGRVLKLDLALFKDEDTGQGLTISGIGDGAFVWVLDRSQCEYALQKGTVTGTIRARVRIPLPNLSFDLGPLVSTSVGAQFDFSLTGTYAFSMQNGVKSSGKADLTFGAGLYGVGSVGSVFGGPKLTIFGTVNGAVPIGDNVRGPSGFITAEAEFKLGPWKRSYSWKYTAIGGASALSAEAGLFDVASVEPAAVIESYVLPSGFLFEQEVEINPKLGSVAVYEGAGDAVLANVATDLVDDTEVQLVRTDEGDILAFWVRQSDLFNNQIVYAMYNGTSWSAPVAIPGVDGFNRALAVARDAQGNLVVSFAHADMSGFDLDSDVLASIAAYEDADLWSVTFDGQDWSAPALVSGFDGEAQRVTLATQSDGQVWALWQETDGQESTLLAARWNDANQSWEDVEQVASGVMRGQATLLDIDGVSTLLFDLGVATDGVSEISTSRLHTSTYSGGNWSQPQVLELAVAGPAAAQALAAPQALEDATAFLDINPFVSVPHEVCHQDESELPPLPSLPQIIADAGNAVVRGGASAASDVVGAFDPNDKIGPAAVGDAGWIRDDVLFPYEIHFENDPELGATAPAQRVVITDTLPANLDLSTFQFTHLGFRDVSLTLPQGLNSFTEQFDSTNQDGSPLRVVVSGSIDPTTRQISVTFESIDPDTGLPPAGALDGFLFVEDGNGAGQGLFGYTVAPLANLQTADTIINTAEIVFDFNEPILTPTVTRTIDKTAPSSAVSDLPDTVATASFEVSWSGSDVGAGVAAYDVYVSVDGGPYTRWLDQTTAGSATFDGQDGHTYAFYTRAADMVGLLEDAPANADQVVTVDVPPGTTVEFGDGVAKSLIYTDADGTVVTIGLSGGTAQALIGGDNVTVTPGKKGIVVSGDNLSLLSLEVDAAAAANLKFTTKGGNGRAAVGDLSIDGNAGSISGKTVDFSGDVLISGNVTKVDLGEFLAADQSFTVQGATVAGSYKFGRIADLLLTSAAAIKSLAVAQWLDGGGDNAIVAPSIAKLQSGGDFHADVTLTDAVAPLSLGTLKISGAMVDAVLRAASSVKSISATKFDGVRVLVGVDDNAPLDELPTTPGLFVNQQASLGSVSIKPTGGGASYIDAMVAAWSIGKASLGEVQTSNAGQAMGVAAGSIKSLAYSIGGQIAKLPKDVVPGLVVEEDDFEVQIVA